MTPARPDPRPLRERLAQYEPFHGGVTSRSRQTIADTTTRVILGSLQGGTCLQLTEAQALEGRSVLVATTRQMAAVVALIELDGLARRLVLCPPGLAPEDLSYVLETAAIEVVVTDSADVGPFGALPHVMLDPAAIRPVPGGLCRPHDTIATEWILFTSGTTSRPKMVVHTLASLTAPLSGATAIEQGAVWSTFYDIRRYGGMTILLRALLGEASMVLSDVRETISAFITRAAQDGVTHISGTPSHWRRVLMSPASVAFAPRYVRLSGEVADQALLDQLHVAFPGASVAHAFASTEAGVAFSVGDGREGVPAERLDKGSGAVDLRVQDGSLRIRSEATAKRNLGSGTALLTDADGYIDTGDMLERRGDRYIFVGRREGIINIGGIKVYPEQVEAVINRHPDVLMSRVRARRSPITGAIVVADIVPRGVAENLEAQVIAACRAVLVRHQVPVAVYIVPALDILATGKLARRTCAA
jgi:acyl-CoA synthetase (AMP-forming)/AMP-acid ligase II